MNRILVAAVAAVIVLATGVHAADWRKEGTPEEQQANLVKLVPGASHWMIEMGERYKNLYWAARQEKWAFAAYQAEEIEKLVRQICYRAADLAYLVKVEGSSLSRYSRHLRREPDVEYYEGYFDEEE